MSLERINVDDRPARAGGGDGAPGRLRGPARFAQALRARYRRGARSVPWLELSLAARRDAGDLVLHRHTLHAPNPVTVVLRSVLQRVERPAAQVRIEATLPVATGVAVVERSAQPAAASPVAAPRVPMPVLQRLAARATRIDADRSAWPAPALPLSAPASTHPAPPSPARLPDDLALRRPAGRVTTATPAAPGAASDTGTPTPPRGPANTPAPHLAPHEIERIAEQVMNSLDRRIVAERERRGRF